MLNSIKLNLPEIRKRVEHDPTIPLSRITLFCGPNGSGKSTVLSAFRSLVLEQPSLGKTWTRDTAPALVEGDCRATCFFDSESDNLRTSNMDGVFDRRVLNRWFDAKEMSHGQSNYRALVSTMASDEFDVLVLDEPESALDLDGQLWLREEVLKSSKQFLIATHSPILLQLAATTQASGLIFGKDKDYLDRVLKVYTAVLAGSKLPRPAKRAVPACLKRR